MGRPKKSVASSLPALVSAEQKGLSNFTIDATITTDDLLAIKVSELEQSLIAQRDSLKAKLIESGKALKKAESDLVKNRQAKANDAFAPSILVLKSMDIKHNAGWRSDNEVTDNDGSQLVAYLNICAIEDRGCTNSVVAKRVKIVVDCHAVKAASEERERLYKEYIEVLTKLEDLPTNERAFRASLAKKKISGTALEAVIASL